MADPWERREQVGDCTLYLGDCVRILPHLDPVPNVVTDPPYGVNVAEWDREINAVWPEVIRTTEDAHAFVFWSVSRLLEFVPIPGMRYERVLVWHKPMTFSSQRGGATWHWEPVFWYRSGAAKLVRCVSDVFTANPPLTRLHPENVAHPTQKPLAPVRWLVNMTGAGVVLDPFMGSGTTGVAAVQEGRPFVGIEADPKHFETALGRIRAAVRQPDLFVSAPKVEQASLFGDG